MAKARIKCVLYMILCKGAAWRAFRHKTSCAQSAPPNEAKSSAHEIFAHVGRLGPPAEIILSGHAALAAHGQFAMRLYSKKGGCLLQPPFWFFHLSMIMRLIVIRYIAGHSL